MSLAQEEVFSRLAERLRSAAAPSADLVSEVVAEACPRLPRLRQSAKAARLESLIEAGAWTDAALLLVELELPGWKLRRLAGDEDGWHCALSRQAYLPIELDDTADGHHPALPLAILDALLQACRRAELERGAGLRPAARVAPAPRHGLAICCDNFS
jgi:hypothetical protein